ncbi:MAG: hypothetical protein M1834_004539 [Cirrosporium novae-zelandiae]|nr:MAG: hypothetical protein M1834_004539 [Cirrosporium novae-zelandiae]
MSFANIWHLRKVADTSTKACYICYKPTTSVLITPDNKDFFYVCPGHLKDRGFCSPIVDEAEEAAKKKKAELDLEIEKVKKEYEEKIKKKKDKNKDKSDKPNDDKDKKKEDDELKKAEAEKDKKIKAVTNAATTISSPKADEGPRIFTLHKNFYQMRLDRIKNAELAKRNRERLRNPTLFPSVPKGDL